MIPKLPSDDENPLNIQKRIDDSDDYEEDVSSEYEFSEIQFLDSSIELINQDELAEVIKLAKNKNILPAFTESSQQYLLSLLQQEACYGEYAYQLLKLYQRAKIISSLNCIEEICKSEKFSNPEIKFINHYCGNRVSKLICNENFISKLLNNLDIYPSKDEYIFELLNNIIRFAITQFKPFLPVLEEKTLISPKYFNQFLDAIGHYTIKTADDVLALFQSNFFEEIMKIFQTNAFQENIIYFITDLIASKALNFSQLFPILEKYNLFGFFLEIEISDSDLFFNLLEMIKEISVLPDSYDFLIKSGIISKLFEAMQSSISFNAKKIIIKCFSTILYYASDEVINYFIENNVMEYLKMSLDLVRSKKNLVHTLCSISNIVDALMKENRIDELEEIYNDSDLYSRVEEINDKYKDRSSERTEEIRIESFSLYSKLREMNLE